MSVWWASVPVEVTADDRALAFTTAAKLLTTRPRERVTNKFWTPLETAAYGFLGQIAAARYLGLAHAPTYVDRGGDPRPDVGNWQVKTTPWRTIEHFHLCDGGWTWVQPREARCASRLMRLSYFLKGPGKVWIDGWLPMAEVTKSPLAGSLNSPVRAYKVSYDRLWEVGSDLCADG